jgi:hypothetical protein
MPLAGCWRWLAILPDAVAAGVAGLCAAAVTLLMLGAFHPLAVLVVAGGAGLVLAVAAAWRPPPVARRERAPLVLALSLCAAAGLVNAALSSEFVFNQRDPAIYAATARWLVDHPSLDIETRPDVFGDLPGLEAASNGFERAAPGQVYAQGAPALPAVLAIGGWVGGNGMLLRVNAALGAGFLLALFGLTRRVAGAWPALAVTAVMAVSLPFLAFTRSPYTEPVTGLLVLGGLSVLWRAQREDRPLRFAVAGTILGSTALVRIDGYTALLALVVVATVSLASAPAARRWRTACCFAALFAPVLVLGGLALTALAIHSADYLANLRSALLAVALAAGGLAAAGGATIWATGQHPSVLVSADRHRRRLGTAAGMAVLAAALVLASRPLWFVSRLAPPDSRAETEAWQRAFHQPVDGARSYDEATLTWLAWYHGWPAVILGVLGLAWLVRRTVARRQGLPLPVLLVVGSVALLYLNRQGIFPDHIWAMRRFLPVVVPGLLLGVAVVLRCLAARGRGGTIAAIATWVVVLATTAGVSAPLAGQREYVGQLAEVERVCQAVGRDGALLLTGGFPASGYLQTFRSFCGVPVQSASGLGQPELAAAASAAEAAGRTLFLGHLEMTPPADARPPAGMTLLGETHLTKWEERLAEVPAQVYRYPRRTYLAQVRADGRLLPARSARAQAGQEERISCRT